MSKLIIFLSVFLSISSFSASALTNSSSDNSMLLENEKNTIKIFKANVKSVVNVSNIKLSTRGWFFDGTPQEVPQGSGSGFVWDKKGHIVTNFHVVSGGDTFLVSFNNDKKQYRAKIVGAEPRKDIAVLKLEKLPKQLYPITAGTSSNLQVGQKTLAIGNPFGLDHTITQGIVSALGRKIPGFGGVEIFNMIQTDSSINPGNSGGPLLNSSGQLIGMNTMIFSNSGSSAGIGFAVPVDTINLLVPDLIKHGKVIRPALGVVLLGDQYQQFFGVNKGIVIKSILEDGPADRMGLHGMSRDRYGEYYIGDIILSINDMEVNNYNDIYHALDKFKIGDKVNVKIKRDRKIKTLKIKLENSDFR